MANEYDIATLKCTEISPYPGEPVAEDLDGMIIIPYNSGTYGPPIAVLNLG